MARYLLAEEGPLKGLKINLEEGTEWIIGRDPESCDFILEDSTVSRSHLILTKTETEEIALKNLSSVNPCLVNGKAVKNRKILHDKDQVQIGQNLFLYVDENNSKKKSTTAFDNIFEDIPETPSPKEEAPTERTAYDTIFEDVQEYEEAPLHLLGEATLILK